MAPLRLLLISLHLLVAVVADFYDEPGGGTSLQQPQESIGFSHEPDDVVVTRGQSARLDCLVRPLNNNNSFNILWFQDGLSVILPDQRRHLLPNGSLLFDKVLHKRSGRSSDEGVYFCLAQQTSGGGAFISRNASVRVAGLAKDFTWWPADVLAETGDSVRLNCAIDSLPEAQFSWEKDGEQLNIDSIVDEHQYRPEARFVALQSGVLHIYNVQEADSGTYRCVARNALAEKERKSPAGRLTVSAASDRPREPQFITPATNSSLWVVQGGNVTLECLLNSSPITRWTLNSSLIADRPGFLSLTNIDSTMAGDYACSDTNVTVTRLTTVHVTTLPLIIRAPISQVFPTAKTVRFECEVTGTPTPIIRWLKDGRIVPIGGRIKNRMQNEGTISELVLSNTVTQDSGIYQCQAVSQSGVSSASARLVVNMSEGTRPEPPTKLKATSTNTEAIQLSWDPPRNVPVEDVQAYTVHLMPLAGDGSEELQEVALNTSIRIENLKRNTNYSFYVRAYVRKSASDPSEKFIFSPQTLRDGPAPSRPPPRTLSPTMAAPNVTLLPLSPNTLKVSWRKFSPSVPLYKIQYRRHRGKEFDIEAVKGDVYEYRITGLHPGRKYDVRVVPGNINVNGPWFTIEMPKVMAETTTTPLSNPLAAPSVELLAINATSVMITWEDMGPSTGRQKANHCQLTYRMQGGRETSPIVILAPSGSHWITKLGAGTVYEFQVTCNSLDGEAGPTTLRTIRTLWETLTGIYNEMEDDLDVEQRPFHIEALVLSSNSVKLSWKPLETSNNNILYYTIRYAALPDETGTRYSMLSAIGYIRTTNRHVLIDNLTAYTSYQISVRAHDRQGRSSAFSTLPSTVHTPEALPGAPMDPLWTVTGDGVVNLSWKSPYPPNGLILGYAINISMNNSDNCTRLEETGLQIRLTLLVPDTLYYVRVQARTSVGWGPFSDQLTGRYSLPRNWTEASSNTIHDIDAFREQYLSIFIGLAVSLAFAFVCLSVMFWRKRCIKRQSVTVDSLPVCNGVHHKPAVRSGDQRSSYMEMESFVPMLATIPVDDPSHHDTKGGYATGSRGSHQGSLCNGSIRRSKPASTEDEERSELPLLSDVADATLLSQATETTCLDYSSRQRGSLHSHDSSLHSLGSSGSDSSRSLRGQDDNDTGICHADHQMNERGSGELVIA